MDPGPGRPVDRRGLVTQLQIYPSPTPILTPQNGASAPAPSPSPAAATAKMVGYLEKRSKMIGWKRFWFVLDGALLTYYRTKTDYDSACAPCLGSINLGLASSVRPLQAQRGRRGYPLQITTRGQIYYLRSLDKSVLEKWLLALQETASAPPEISSPTWADPGVQFYRYSFASGSQWSLAASTDDISGSLRDLPRNFYLKPPSAGAGTGFLGPPAATTTQMSKSQSLVCLNVPTGGDMPKATSSPSPKNKLHPRLSDSTAVRAGTGATGLRPGSLTCSPAPPAKPIRQATSMLMLPSSEVEAALRRELSTALFKRSASTLGKEGEDKESEQQQRRRRSRSPSGAAVYDEIIDFEAALRASVQSSSSSCSGDDSASTSAVSDVSSPPSSPAPPPALAPTFKPEMQSTLTPTTPTPHPHIKGYGQTRTPWELRRRGEVAQSRIIYHVEEEEPPTLSGGGSDRKKKGIGGFFQKIFKKDKDKEGKDGSHGGQNKGSRSRSGSASSARSRSGSTHTKAGGGLGAATRQHDPVISGPVDLRAVAEKSKLKPKPPTTLAFASGCPPAPEGRLTLTPDGGGVASPLKKTVNVEPPRSPHLETVMAELKSRVGQINSKSNEAMSTTPVVVPSPDIYQNNLGKFNRLSAHLNPTFVAILNKQTLIPEAGGTSYDNGHATSSAVPRSNSLSSRYASTSAKEEPPLLPPKKRRGEPTTRPAAPAYDVPQNNQPVPGTANDAQALSPTSTLSGLVNLSSVYNACNGNGKGVVRLRDLTKKNSAPDVVFPAPPAPGPRMSRAGDGTGKGPDSARVELPILLQLNIVPPPSTPAPGILAEELDCSSCACRDWPPVEAETDEDEDVVDGPPPPLPLAPAPTAHTLPEVLVSETDSSNGNVSATANSVDFDNLDGLSDVSAGGNGRLTLPSSDFLATHLGAEESAANAIVYENLPPLKYATINTLVTELETVEEIEDEQYDYEEFVIDGSHVVAVDRPKPKASATNHRQALALPSPEIIDDDVFSPSRQASRVDSVRNSGIDALQRYIWQNSPASGNTGKAGGGVISRLGHSAAVNQLHALLQNDRQ